jgi:GDP-mannose 6-dehydrogenase
MKIAVFGLGYVGTVSSACFARDGHKVIGVDIQPEKVQSMQQGYSTIIEPGLDELIKSSRSTGNLEATSDAYYAIAEADVALICVGTPSLENGSLNLSYVERVCGEIGKAIKIKSGYTIVVIRSTILPGVAQNRLIPIIEEESGKQCCRDFGFCVNPEFLREGNAITDFYHPPYTIIGEIDNNSGAIVSELYKKIASPIFRVTIGVAEMVKYTSNIFHALKVVFANEIGNLCKEFGVDSHQVMDIFVRDEKLNLSKAYLKPGFSYGGSCLGKDLRAMLHSAKSFDLKLPVLEAIEPSNQMQIDKAFDLISRTGKRKVDMIGLSFKSDTDDLRESPAIELAERLIGKGYDFHVYDHEVSLSQIHGSNQAYINQVIPHINSLMRSSLEILMDEAEVIVLTKRLPTEIEERFYKLLRSDHVLIDLVHLNDSSTQKVGSYHGICW